MSFFNRKNLNQRNKEDENEKQKEAEQLPFSQFVRLKDRELILTRLEKEGLKEKAQDFIDFLKENKKFFDELDSINSMAMQMDRLGRTMAEIEKVKTINIYIARYKTEEVLKAS